MISIKKLVLVAAVGLLGHSSSALADSQPWLLPNGDFRHSGAARALLQNWTIFSRASGNESKLSDNTFAATPKTLILKQTQAQNILAYQTLLLPPGQYRLTIELTPGSGKAIINVSENPAVVFDGAAETVHDLDLTFQKGGDVRIHIGTADVGEIGIVKAELEHISSPVSALPMADGKALDRIVLPVEPTMAERFAAWETLTLCWRMTGAIPEICHAASASGDILIGRAAILKVTDGAAADTYLYGMDANGDLNLTGNTDRGTLYAVYRYFNSQGCSWTLPGKEGETIPTRESLTLPDGIQEVSPRYEVRGYMLTPQSFKIDNGWEFFPYEDCCDWALRNGLNALWAAGGSTYDMMEWRGGCFMQMLNHSWHKFLLDDHPEWWPLVNGKRLKMHESGLPNQPCLSNPALRDYAVEMICDFFKKNPQYDRYPLNAEDEPCYWCECEACCALDTVPHVHGKASPKTDRSLNFVNDVARRVAERCPGKTIELYGYGSNREAPTREILEPHIVYKWCFHLTKEPRVMDTVASARLSDWREKGGLTRLAIYDYDNYVYPDAIWSGLRYSFEELIDLNKMFGAVEYLPESWTNLWGNPLMFQLRRDALWNAEKEDFDSLVARHCAEFYGKAADLMTQYIMAMDRAFISGQMELEARPVKDTNIVYLPQLTMKDLTDADALLDKAAALAADDVRLEKRIACVRFSHDMTKLSLMTNLKEVSFEDIQVVFAAYKEANELARKYSMYLSRGAINQLAFFYMPPLVEKTLVKLPVDGWRFCTDPEKKGLTEEWFKSSHPDWKTIRVDKDWTGQGYDYHGTAWYELEFETDKDLDADLLAFHFEAIDGRSRIYLDGELVGEQQEDPGKMWQLPFAIKCKPIAKGSHRLTVSVEKDMWAAGIWKPVSIIEMQNRKVEEDGVRNKELVM